jgi:Zn-dependent peptidase ImmA (M78 family)
MPRTFFLRSFRKPQPEPIDQLARVAADFKVSQSAVAIRLRDLGMISQEQLDEQLAIAARLAEERRERDRERSRDSGGGPPHYRTQLRNLGPTYVGLVLDALHSNEISPVDASYFLESKLSTIDQMEQELVRRGASA